MPLVKIECCKCKTIFEIPKSYYKQRLKRSKSGKLFCSIKCNSLYLKDLYKKNPELRQKQANNIYDYHAKWRGKSS